jgi:hypothetical protein
MTGRGEEGRGGEWGELVVVVVVGRGGRGKKGRATCLAEQQAALRLGIGAMLVCDVRRMHACTSPTTQTRIIPDRPVPPLMLIMTMQLGVAGVRVKGGGGGGPRGAPQHAGHPPAGGAGV